MIPEDNDDRFLRLLGLDPEHGGDLIAEADKAVADLRDILAAFAISQLGVFQSPRKELKDRILAHIDAIRAKPPLEEPLSRPLSQSLSQPLSQSLGQPLSKALGEVKTSLSVVLTDAEGILEWINEPFTRMCGYEFHELKGHKPGHILQGPETDPKAVARIRKAVKAGKAAVEELVNYHKDGHPYRVAVSISPIHDFSGQVAHFIALEREIPMIAANPEHSHAAAASE